MAVRSVARRLPLSPWVQLSLGWGAVLAVVWSAWATTGVDERVVRDLVVYLLGPAVLAAVYGRHIGWRVDRRALRNTLLLALFVLPFYVVGSSLPTVRAYYPMWGATAAPSSFVPHTAKQFLIVLATETYYRGLLCVGVRSLGFVSVFISPVLYALHHVGKPPIEIALSGPTDVLFGAVDYRSDSILPSVVAHGAGLALLDWLVLHPPLLAPETVLGWLRWVPIPL